MYINIILYVWFTHLYSETVYHADKDFISRHIDEISKWPFNGGNFDPEGINRTLTG